MEAKDEWVFFREIDWNDPKNNKLHIDTRDFHCGYFYKEEKHPDWKTIKKYNHFFFTEEELKKVIERLYIESGGKGGWRFLVLKSHDRKVLDWNLKYIRIWRTEKGFLICNRKNQAISEKVLRSEVDKEHLNYDKRI